jgi:hypothetical protein
MRKVRVDLSELVSAQETNFPEMSHFLDLETGEVVMSTEDDSSAAEDFLEQVEIQGDESDEVIQAKVQEWIKESDFPEWEEEGIASAVLVEMHFGERFINIPAEESHDGYNDMADFASTMKDEHLERLLSVALNGKGAFRRFKDVLYDYPEERERWFEFSQDCKEKRAREWLESEDIEIET